MGAGQTGRGPSYTDYNIGLQWTLLAPAQPLPTRSDHNGRCGLEPAALHEFCSFRRCVVRRPRTQRWRNFTSHLGRKSSIFARI